MPSPQSTNPVIAFPAARPELKLLSAAERAEALERQQLSQDHDALRDREANLRDYEARLRAWQAQIEGSLQQPPMPAQYVAPVAMGRAPSLSPFEGDAALQAGWEKLHRARELLEAEQAHVREDRLNLKETAAVLKRHEATLIAREASLAQREEALSAALAARMSEPVRSPSAITRLTNMPFTIAKTVFGGKPPEEA